MPLRGAKNEWRARCFRALACCTTRRLPRAMACPRHAAGATSPMTIARPRDDGRPAPIAVLVTWSAKLFCRPKAGTKVGKRLMASARMQRRGRLRVRGARRHRFGRSCIRPDYRLLRGDKNRRSGQRQTGLHRIERAKIWSRPTQSRFCAARHTKRWRKIRCVCDVATRPEIVDAACRRSRRAAKNAVPPRRLRPNRVSATEPMRLSRAIRMRAKNGFRLMPTNRVRAVVPSTI